MSPLNRRRNYFIDKRVQGLWAIMNLLIIGTVGLFVGLEVLRSFYADFGWPFAGKPFNLPDLMFLIKLIVLTLVSSGFIWILSAFAGHRIAGPIYRLEQSLKEVIKGNYSIRIQFRKKDFFQDIAETFNVMSETLENKSKKQDELLSQLQEKVKSLPQDNPKVQELKKLLNV